MSKNNFHNSFRRNEFKNHLAFKFEKSNITAKQLDEDTVLYYYNARWYDPGIGRFVSEDPVRDGLAWYAYANGNPLRFVDPSGLMTNDEVVEFARSQNATDDEIADLQNELNTWGNPGEPGYSMEPGEAQSILMQEMSETVKSIKELQKERDKALYKDPVEEALGEKIAELLSYTKMWAAIYGTDFLAKNTDIEIETGVFGERGYVPWDGRLGLYLFGILLHQSRVHTWADDGGETTPHGLYFGRLRHNNPQFKYSNAIRLFADILIHSDVSPGSGDEPHQRFSIQFPDEAPGGQGCMIVEMMGFIDMTKTLTDIGFTYNNTEDVNVSINPYGYNGVNLFIR